MTTSRPGLLGKFLWTAGTFGASFSLRLGLNVIQSRLLGPEILGVIVVVAVVRLGVELLTDVGIEQNIIHNDRGLERDFLHTAWTMQVLRGLFLSLLFAAMAPMLARLYGIDVRIFLVVAISPLLGALHSTAIFVLVKKLEVKKRNLFEIGSETIGFVVAVTLAVWLRSVWAPVMAMVITVATRSALSYLLPDPRQRFMLQPAIARQIIAFGKWIAAATIVTYAASYIDRLYLGRVAPLYILGVYGIARTISEIPANLARRMSYQIVFPAIAGAGDAGDKRKVLVEIGTARWTAVALVALAMAFGIAFADKAIALVYDQRYRDAGWMLSLLLTGAWFSVLSNLNEALLLGAGKPAYSSYANLARLITIAIGLPIAFTIGGFAGAVVAMSLVEFLQYIFIAIGLWRVRLAFWRQDGLATAIVCAVLILFLLGRVLLGWGMPWEAVQAGVR